MPVHTGNINRGWSTSDIIVQNRRPEREFASDPAMGLLSKEFAEWVFWKLERGLPELVL